MQISGLAHPVAAEAEPTSQLGVAGHAAQARAQQPLGQIEMPPVEMGVSGDEQVRPGLLQQPDQAAAAEQDGAGFPEVLPLHEAPVQLVQTGLAALNPVV